jgi:hypothetical protein
MKLLFNKTRVKTVNQFDRLSRVTPRQQSKVQIIYIPAVLQRSTDSKFRVLG